MALTDDWCSHASANPRYVTPQARVLGPLFLWSAPGKYLNCLSSSGPFFTPGSCCSWSLHDPTVAQSFTIQYVGDQRCSGDWTSSQLYRAQDD